MKELAVMADDSTAQGDGQSTGDGASTVDNTAADQQDAGTSTGRHDLPPEVKRALNKANKEAETLRLKLKEFEDRDKTEAQKLADDRDGHKSRADAAEAALAKFRVAAEKGLSAELAARLQGSTEDELRKDADSLLKLLPNGAGVSFDGGTRTTADAPVDMNAVIRNHRSTR